MHTRFLFPHRYKAIGWVLFAVGVVLGVLYLHFHWEPDGLDVIFPTWWPTIINLPADEAAALANMPGQVATELYRHNILPEISGLCCIVGGLLAACSRERHEDEFIMRLRLESLLWALYVNYALLAVVLLLTYDNFFFNAMVYSMFTPLVLFLLRFHYVLFRSSRAARYAE